MGALEIGGARCVLQNGGVGEPTIVCAVCVDVTRVAWRGEGARCVRAVWWVTRA